MYKDNLKKWFYELGFPMLYETGGNREYISPNIFSFTGIYVEEFSANRDLFPGKINPEDYVEANHKIREWHKHNEKGVLATEFRFKTAYGDYIWMEDYLICMKPAGKPKYMAGIMIDVTEEKNERLKILQRIFLEKKKETAELKLQNERLFVLDENKQNRGAVISRIAEVIERENLSMEEVYSTCFPIQ